MSVAITTKTVKASCSIAITKSDLTERKVGELKESPRQNVPCSNGLQWWVKWYPAGRETEGFVSVFISVNKTCDINVDATFSLDVTDAANQFKTSFKNSSQWGYPIFISHNVAQELFRDDKLTITCSANFEIQLQPAFVKHNIFQSCEDVPTDCELVVGTDSVKVHKNLLQFIAPGLHANFIHNTVESRSGRVTITDFEYKTVKASMDYLYGRELEDTSIETVIGILRFADKYNIKSAELEDVPFLNIDEESFCTIVHYAFDCCKDALFAECAEFFKDHQDNLKTADQFAKLPPAAIVHILESAFSLTDTYQVLRHAQKHGIPGVIDHLEPHLFATLSLTTFCPIASYAWDHSREDLKTKCAELFNDNRLEITKMEDFVILKDVVVGILELSLKL